MSQNQIKLLNDKIFSNLNELRFLDLSRNKLSMESNKEIFVENVNLEILNLSNNEIKILAPTLFLKNRKLRKLYISSNHLLLISKNLLENLVELEEINLSQNSIKEIPEKLFQHCRKLKVVNFSNNKINEIPEKLFQSALHLEEVWFAYNQIEILSPIFATNSKLQRIFFFNNRLIKISPKNFPKGFDISACNNLQLFSPCSFYGNPCTGEGFNRNNISQCMQKWDETERSIEDGKFV